MDRLPVTGLVAVAAAVARQGQVVLEPQLAEMVVLASQTPSRDLPLPTAEAEADQPTTVVLLVPAEQVEEVLERMDQPLAQMAQPTPEVEAVAHQRQEPHMPEATVAQGSS